MNEVTEVERIATTKNAYTLTIGIRSDGSAHVCASDPIHAIAIRLDDEDLRRIRLLLEDHRNLYENPQTTN